MKNNIGHNNPPQEVRLTDGEIIILDKQGRVHFAACCLMPDPRHIHKHSMSNGTSRIKISVLGSCSKGYILIKHNVLSLIAFLWYSQISFLIGLNPINASRPLDLSIPTLNLMLTYR